VDKAECVPHTCTYNLMNSENLSHENLSKRVLSENLQIINIHKKER
jgi:hypothetical protein